MYLIDSSVWVALFLDFDASHQKAVEIFSQLDGTIYVPYCVVAETATVLAYKHSKRQADNFLEYLTNNQNIILFENQIFPEIEFFKKVESRISFTDTSLIYLAQKMNLSLITFDRQIISFVV